MRKVTKEDLKKGLEVRWYEHGRRYIIESVDENNVELSGYSKNTVPVDSVLENCYVPKSKVMRYIGEGYKNLTNSKNYNVEEGGTGYYHLIDNDGVKVAVIKSLFEEPSANRDTMLSPQMQRRSVFAQIRCRGRSQEAIDALNAEKGNVKPPALPLERCELVGIKKNQIGGTHYNKNDPIQFARDNYSPAQLEGFFRINVDKYIARYPNKNGLEDLYKAKHYLDMLIDLKEKQDAK